MHDTKDEVYSMAVKRLSQTDDMQIVVEQTLLTDKYMLGIPDSNRDRFMAYMNYSTVKNKIDKVQLYKEWFYKAYMIVNEKAYIHTDKLLDGNTWYDSDRTARICQKYVELVTSRGKLKTAVTNAERMKINKEIKTEVQDLIVKEYRRKQAMDNKVPQQINDIVGDNVKKLAQLFPSAVKDGEVDFEALKEELGQYEEVGSEKYELTWAGKKNAKKIAQEDVIGRTLKFIPEDSKDADTTENLYIEGDNLEVLKLIRQNYYGAIKIIYIDPPYNTGNDFIYNDHLRWIKMTQTRKKGLCLKKVSH